MLFSCIFCRWLSSKEIHKEDIRYWKREIPRLMCEMKKYLTLVFFNAKEHYLIHQVEEIKLFGPIKSRSMWMVEMHLNSLKDFVRQREHHVVYMVQGYMLYQSMVYISQYLPNLSKNINLPFGMSNPSTNLKGRSYWGKVERGK